MTALEEQTGAQLVAAALSKTAARGYKPIAVEKQLEPQIDLGTLLFIDADDLDTKNLQKDKDEYLLNLTRSNTQLLFNKIWELPTERIDETVVVNLPKPAFGLPRAQRVPKPKPLTKWQQFAKDKGIQKKSKPKASWDDDLQKWVPAYGYQRASAQKDKDWVLEVPKNLDPMTDMFAKKADAKSEKVAKNELQRMKNLARAQKVKVPRTGFPVTSDKATSSQLTAAITVARSATASAGKFQDKLPKEKDARGKEATPLVTGAAKKRKAPAPDISTEKQNNLSLIDTIVKKQPRLDVNLGVTKEINQEQADRSDEKKSSKPKAGKRVAGKGGKNTFSGSKGKKAGKPAAGKGQRNPSKRNIGRKRR